MKTIPVRTVYLQMFAPPAVPLGPAPQGVEVVRVERPAVPFYRFLYDTVGRRWNWVDRKLISDDELRRIIHQDLVEVYLLTVDGQPAGFCELDRRTDGQIELAYFGLLPRFLGRGLGRYFLDWALHRAWVYAPRRVWVHTCQLDHHAALGMYQQAGLAVYDERIVEQRVP